MSPATRSTNLQVLTGKVDTSLAEKMVKGCTRQLDKRIFAKSSIPADSYHWQELVDLNISWLYRNTNAEAEFLAGVRAVEFYSHFFDGIFGKVEPIITPNLSSLSDEQTEEGYAFVEDILAFSRKQGFTHLTASVETGDGITPIVLAGKNFFLANTVVIYALQLSEIKGVDTSAAIRMAKSSDEPALREIAAECFGDRKNSLNHFNNDPQFKSAQVKDYFATWASKCLDGSLADAVIVYDDKELAGFLAIEMPTAAERAAGIHLAKIPLNAVHPRWQRLGIYNILVSHALKWLGEQGIEWVEIGTSLSSKIHTTWQRLGAEIYRSYYQFHYHD